MKLLINSIITAYNNTITSNLSDEEKTQKINEYLKHAQRELQNLNKDKKSAIVPKFTNKTSLFIDNKYAPPVTGHLIMSRQPIDKEYDIAASQVQREIKKVETMIATFNISKNNPAKAATIDLLPIDD
jgi:hypothetical protein